MFIKIQIYQAMEDYHGRINERLKRTCRCAELSEKNIGQEVTVMGWVQKARNTGGLIFVDLRDRSGLLQINFQEEKLGQELFDKAYKLRSEFVIAVVN